MPGIWVQPSIGLFYLIPLPHCPTKMSFLLLSCSLSVYVIGLVLFISPSPLVNALSIQTTEGICFCNFSFHFLMAAQLAARRQAVEDTISKNCSLSQRRIQNNSLHRLNRTNHLWLNHSRYLTTGYYLKLLPFHWAHLIIFLFFPQLQSEMKYNLVVRLCRWGHKIAGGRLSEIQTFLLTGTRTAAACCSMCGRRSKANWKRAVRVQALCSRLKWVQKKEMWQANASAHVTLQ